MRVLRRLNPAGDDGFTLIECLVAATLLIVGLLGTFAMVDQANSAEGASATRESATNLGREFLETIRGDAYASITSSLLSTELQAMPGYVSGTGPVVIQRRNVGYTLDATVTSIDDPKDGLAPTDTQPDDLKRITADISWGGRRAGQIKLVTMLSSNGAKIGIKMSSFTLTSPASPTITSTAVNSAQFSATATGVTKMIFAVDGTDQATTMVSPSGNCTGSPCTKTFTWNMTGLSDGVYRVTARTVDATGVEGPPMAINITINKADATRRSAPCGVGSTATTGAGCLPVEGGYNYLPNGGTTPIFEIRWQANPQRNVIGYKVETSGGTQVCALDAQGNVTSPTAQSPASAPGIDSYACIDTSPPAPSASATSYNVYAIYADPTTGSTVNGPVATVSQVGGTPAGVNYTTTPQMTFGLDGTTAQPAGCTDNLSQMPPWAPVANSTSIFSAYGSNTATTTYNFCTPTMATLFPGYASVDLTGNVTISVTGDMNSSNSSNHCYVSWDITKGAGGASMVSNSPVRSQLDLDGGSARQEQLSGTAAVSSDPNNIPSTTRLALALVSTGTKCGSARIVYGGSKSGQTSPVMPAPGTVNATFRLGTAYASTLFARPNPPTATSRVASGTDMQVKWTGSAGGNVAFYRIYRDGQTYGDRYDTCDVGDLTSAGGCDNGNNTFTYLDQNTGGTAHTYWVTAVYGTGTPVKATMAESSEVAVP